MTPAQYAKQHNLGLNYVYRLIRAGRLAAVQVDGKLRYRITGTHERLKPGRKRGGEK